MASAASTRPLPAARQRHVGLPLPQLKFATFNVRSLRNKVDATSDLFRRSGFGCRTTSAPSSRLTPSTPHWRLTCLTARDWIAHCCRDNTTLVNRMVDARPCNGFVVLRRVRNSRTIIIIIIIINAGSQPPAKRQKRTTVGSKTSSH